MFRFPGCSAACRDQTDLIRYNAEIVLKVHPASAKKQFITKRFPPEVHDFPYFVLRCSGHSARGRWVEILPFIAVHH
uniref:Uncharacterized protein n=1 Tax=Paracidobacterium acidisoli TaxID=2303751 RepID=A0A372IJU9_9BACT